MAKKTESDDNNITKFPELSKAWTYAVYEAGLRDWGFCKQWMTSKHYPYAFFKKSAVSQGTIGTMFGKILQISSDKFFEFHFHFLLRTAHIVTFRSSKPKDIP